MVGYCYNKYVCWSGTSVSDIHACRHKFTERYDCWLDAIVKDGKWQGAIVTDMTDGWVQMLYT